MIKGYAATEPGGKLKPFEFDPGLLGDDEVQIKVDYCGLCHSDLSMLNNDWGITEYPFIPGHEVVGTVESVGKYVKGIRTGQRVGMGWNAGSCMNCEWCMSGNHNLCASVKGTIIGRYGGFADRVRVQAEWVVPLPDQMDAQSSGPLFCGGITVFNPIVQFDIRPTDRVGVVGIGGLGHMALLFLKAWGCDVTAFSSNPEKEHESLQLGADHFIHSRDPEALDSVEGKFDFILFTVNIPLDLNAYIRALRPKGRLHIVGAITKPVEITIFPMIAGQKSLSGSPVGSPSTIARMLEFAARHNIKPVTENVRFDQVNEALDKLRAGNVRYRIVLSHG